MIAASSQEIYSLFSRSLVLSQRYDYVLIKKDGGLFRLCCSNTAEEILALAKPGEVVLTINQGSVIFQDVDLKTRSELRDQILTFNAILRNN